ncbi:MAG: GYD domain-containing protein [candidate division Zixibacteria bacterium]|nr:GYD domain-containing protein [candidate division Zixibacteria bacterium]
MKTFVLMTKVATPEAQLVEVGAKLRNQDRSRCVWFRQIKQLCPEVNFLAHYALLGYWDYMDIYEAPDEETAAKVSMLSRAHGAHLVESWSAIPYEKLRELAEEIDKLKEGEDI